MRTMVLTTAVVLALAALTAGTASAGVNDMTYAQLDRAAKQEVKRGGIYSMRWGDASPWLKTLCYEMLERKFAPYGTQRWARYIVNRESGCNPGAVNTTYSSWRQRAQGLAQLIPAYHTWVNYSLMLRDIKYGIAVFLRLSKGGRSTGPWAM